MVSQWNKFIPHDLDTDESSIQEKGVLKNGEQSYSLIIDTNSMTKIKNMCQDLIIKSMLYKFYNAHNIKECQKIDKDVDLVS